MWKGVSGIDLEDILRSMGFFSSFDAPILSSTHPIPSRGWGSFVWFSLPGTEGDSLKGALQASSESDELLPQLISSQFLWGHSFPLRMWEDPLFLANQKGGLWWSGCWWWNAHKLLMGCPYVNISFSHRLSGLWTLCSSFSKQNVVFLDIQNAHRINDLKGRETLKYTK